MNFASALDAPIKVSRTISTGRQCMAPIEGRGTVVHLDHRLDQLVVHTASQMPHIVRNGLSECLGIEQGRLRIVSPDVGGGFGYKAILLAEDVCLAWLALRVGHPVRWLEDRREHLTANANCREHHYRITAYAERDGTLRGIDCEATVDSGAYSAYPFSACLEAAQVASILPGPYDFPAYRCRTWSVATNKCPILPYRGVARTGVCFAMELVLDAVAMEAGIEPHVVREKNLVRADQMPFDNITNKHFDSGDYPQALARALEAIDVEAVRARQRTPEPDGRRIGLGLSIYCEQAAHGTSVYSGWGIPMVPGHEQAGARLTPTGASNCGSAPIPTGRAWRRRWRRWRTDPRRAGGAHAGRPRRHRDDALLHRLLGLARDGDGGGAVAAACRELEQRALRIGAHLLQADPAACRFEAGRVVGPSGMSASRRSPTPGTGARRISAATSIRAGSRSPPATSRSAILAPSRTPPTRPWSRSIPISGRWRSSTTSSSRTAAPW